MIERIHKLKDLQGDSVELCLTYCGWEYCAPLHRFGPNRRPSWVLHIVLEGKGTLEMGGRVYELQKNDAFLLPAGAEAWYEADQDDPWAYMWMGFAGIKADECAGNAGFSMRSPVRQVSCAEIIHGYIEQMMEASQSSQANEWRRNGLLMLAFAQLMEDYRQQTGENGVLRRDGVAGSEYVRQSIEYMARCYNQRIKIGDLAEHVGVNRSYLTVVFRRNVGLSPQEFLLKLRMERAAMMLQETTMPVGAVAEAVGYGDQLTFSKAFRRFYGKSPSMMRK